MTQTYRTDDGTKWGSGKGSNLTPAEVDINFWDAIQRIVALEALPSAAAGIDHFSVSGTQFYVVMTDATTLGPYTLPVAAFLDRGAWAPSTSYAVLNTFTINGGLYVVIFAHTSGLTFDAGANDGLGHDYYQLMIQTPGSSLPTGGATAQVLQKASGTDYATTWGYKLPIDGGTRQVLLKNSGTNQDAVWDDVDAADVVFTPVTGSSITATNVADAIEEASGSGGVAKLIELTDVLIDTGDLPGLNGLPLRWNNSSGFWEASQLALTNLSDINVTEGSGIDGYYLTWNNSSSKWNATKITDVLEYVIDGGGVVITTGVKGYLEIPYGCVITGAKILGDQTGSVIVDIWKCTYAQFDAGATHPVAGDKITASAPLTMSSAVKAQSTLTGWTTTIAAGDILAFSVTSATTTQRVTISLKVTR